MRFVSSVMGENEALYRKEFGHKPYFTLTPDGARALKALLEKAGIKNNTMAGSYPPSGMPAYFTSVPYPVLLQFLQQALHLPIRETESTVGSNALHKLLGHIVVAERKETISTTPDVEEEPNIKIDLGVLDFLIDPIINHHATSELGR